MALSERSLQQAVPLLIHWERRDESEREASEGVTDAVCVLGRGDAGRPRPIQWLQSAQVKSATNVPFSVLHDVLLIPPVWVQQGCLGKANLVCGLEIFNSLTSSPSTKLYIWWFGRISFGLRTAVEPHCLLPAVRSSQLLLQIPLQLSPSKPLRESLMESEKWLLIWADEYRFVSVAQNQSSAGVVVGSLWSVHHEHERTHLPFCSLLYRLNPTDWRDGDTSAQILDVLASNVWSRCLHCHFDTQQYPDTHTGISLHDK